MRNKKTPSTKTEFNEAAGPRRPLRKPPTKPQPSSKPTSPKPIQPSKPPKPSKK